MIHLLWIVVVTLITFSIIIGKPQWYKDAAVKRKHTNDKYKLPAEFWKDVNHIEILLMDMNESNAKVVFQHINAFNDRYMRYAMNYTYDQQVTRLINKYNNKISIITKTK